MADLANEDKPAIAPPVFVFQKEKAQKRSADGSSAEDGEDSDKDEGSYCPPVKRERTSSFPPPHSVPKNNVFMPSSFCQSPTGNSDSEPEEKPVGFRLKPPTLIHGQAPSSGVPSQKPKEQQRSVLRPAVLQAPPSKSHIESNSSCGTNGVKKSSDGTLATPSLFLNNTEHSATLTKSMKHENEEDGASGNSDGGGREMQETDEAISFVFGQNIKDRAKVEENSTEGKSKDGVPLDSQSEGTNYFLQYISTPSSKNATNSTDSAAKFVFGQNMSERVLSPPKGESANEENKEVLAAPASEPSSQEATPEKDSQFIHSAYKLLLKRNEVPQRIVSHLSVNSVSESLEESAAAYTKATAKKCILEKVDVKTGEESESNVLQMQCKLYVFEKTAQSWIERGRGLLRLNDMASTDDGSLQSRLVMRTQGSLRLILNTKLWPQMQVDKASEKSVRITAMDTEDQGVKVFLISGSSKDVGQLASALHHRILALKSRVEQEPETPTTTIPDTDVPQSNEDDSDEDDNASASASAPASAPATSNSEGEESQAAGST
ncbi:ran-binding protein 3b isoform X1 [Hippoglossus hippoglossus]|uniref:ran-binding protein 3b isoform X1 n=1 Tax=Hippoglossus hippoglossus TaxID=8267 RepID=UPI00148CDAE7|nr:ran-binding protein 3b isoform X1 [Hippoglossus hippoglossus]XP_035026350.1 ran-binding protein 3b isoform X2 [Hippoglossus stenolepis]